MSFFLRIIALTIVCGTGVLAQGSAGSSASYESRSIVDMPTAGVLPKGRAALNLTTFSQGGLLAEFSYGLLKNFNLGIGFGGTNFIGSGDITFQKLPSLHLKFRFLDETLSLPALTIGAGTQGRGAFYTADKRFQVLSPGIFLAVSKNFRWALGPLATHGGITYSFEPAPERRSPNVYLGLEQSLTKSTALVAEYNANLDEAAGSVYRRERGMLHLALRQSFGVGTLELQIRDALGNIPGNEKFSRWFGMEYFFLL